MTAPADTLERQDAPPMQADGDGLSALLAQLVEAVKDQSAPKCFMSDAQIIERLGIPENTGYTLFRSWDKNAASRFPPKQPECGNRRYFPAVLAYFEYRYRLKIDPSPRRDDHGR